VVKSDEAGGAEGDREGNSVSTFNFSPNGAKLDTTIGSWEGDEEGKLLSTFRFSPIGAKLVASSLRSVGERLVKMDVISEGIGNGDMDGFDVGCRLSSS
jgi:hypothetical protein